MLLSGSGFWEYDDGSGTLVEVEVGPFDVVHIPPGVVHRFTATTDCMGIEWSTPHYDDRVRVEEEYGVEVKGDGPGLPTTDAPRIIIP